MKTLVVDATVWVSAADRTDARSEVSRDFLALVVAREIPIALPDLAELEISCALARRLRDAGLGRGLTARMLESPLITRHSTNRALLRDAVRIGTRDLLRSGDSLYAALAERLGGDLVSWDEELIERAGALTPRRVVEEAA